MPLRLVDNSGAPANDNPRGFDDPIATQVGLDVLHERFRILAGGPKPDQQDTILREMLLYIAARGIIALEAYDREAVDG